MAKLVPMERASAELEDDRENEDEVEELGSKEPGEDVAVLKGESDEVGGCEHAARLDRVKEMSRRAPVQE